MAGFAGWHGVGAPFGGLARCAGRACLNHWIPAFAGMTEGDSGLRRVVRVSLAASARRGSAICIHAGAPINDGGRLTGVAGCDGFPALLPAFQDAVGSRRPC